MTRDYVQFTLNGKTHRISGEYAFRPLSDFLRYEKGLTGTKVVCAEGDCGACTILGVRVLPNSRAYSHTGASQISQTDEGNAFQSNQIHNWEFVSINSCIMTTYLADGMHLISIEGISGPEFYNNQHVLTEIQDSMARNFGGQCGFCTPGFVMSLTYLFENKKKVNIQNIKNYLTGNLCRCTGYQPIIDSALDVDIKKCKSLNELYRLENETEELMKQYNISVHIKFENQEFYAPTNIQEAVKIKSNFPHIRLISGATDLGVQINKGKSIGQIQMSLHLINELYDFKDDGSNLFVGARRSLSQLQIDCENEIPEFSNFLNIFASPQIKNSATLVGNIANASPIADTLPFLMALDAELKLLGANGERIVKLSDFYKGYKTFDLKPDEIITFVKIPKPPITAKIKSYKISQRRDLDISCASSCYNLNIIENGKNKSITEAKVSFGGVAATPIRIYPLEKYLSGLSLDQINEKQVYEIIENSIHPLSDIRGSAKFRKEVLKKVFSKYLHEILLPDGSNSNIDPEVQVKKSDSNQGVGIR